MTVNPDLAMQNYNDLLAGTYVPSDLRYGVDMLKSYRRITQRIQPLSGISFISGNQVSYRLPPNSLIPLDSIRIVGNLKASVSANATGAKVAFNKNLDFCLFQSLVCKSGGRNIDNQQNNYAQIGNIMADMISEDNAKSIRSALVNDVNKEASLTVPPSATINTLTTKVCIKDFLGFLNSGYCISTSAEFTPNFQIDAVLNPVENVICADDGTNITAASYTLESPYLVFDIISYADPNPYSMALARLAAMNIPLRMKFKNYFSISRGVVSGEQTIALNMASHCLQRLYAITRLKVNADSSTGGVKSQDPTTYTSALYTRSRNELSNPRFQIGDLYLPTFWSGETGETQYALYYLAEAFGIQKDTAHGISAIKDFQNGLNSSGAGAINTSSAETIFNDKKYVFMQSLDHIGDYENGMLSGLNTRNIAQDVYFQANFGTETNVIIVGESSAVITILPNSELLIEY